MEIFGTEGVGFEALGELTKAALGARILGPHTHECEVCATGKAQRDISRVAPQNLPNNPGEVMSADLHYPPEPGYNADRYWVLFTCMATGMRFFYSFQKKPGIKAAFKHLRQLLWVQFGIIVKILWCDGEKSLFSKVEVKEIENEGFKFGNLHRQRLGKMAMLKGQVQLLRKWGEHLSLMRIFHRRIG